MSEVLKEEVYYNDPFLYPSAPGVQKASDLCALWEERCMEYDQTHHQCTNFVIDFHSLIEAELTCYVSAMQAKHEKAREFVGSYTFHASLTDEGWRLDRILFQLKFFVRDRALTEIKAGT